MAVVRLQLREWLNQRAVQQGNPITVDDVAQATGISPNTIEMMIDNASDQISLRTLASLCDYLECTPGDLLHYSPDQPEDDVIDVNEIVRGWEEHYGADEHPRV